MEDTILSKTLTIAVVPARGGSKRVPRKNIRPFHGVPLIARSIGTLVDSGLFDHIVTSTEDEEIAQIAQDAGAWVPFRRPPYLADDHTPTVPVVLDAVERIEDLTGQAVGEVLVAYPAAVFMSPTHLQESRKMLQSTGSAIVMSAAEFPAPILRAWRKVDGGSAELIWPEHKLTRSQDLEPTYFDAGQFYWWSAAARDALRKGLDVNTSLYLMPAHLVQDIDTEDDWMAAEAKWLISRP